jgi:hypothetical protein
LTVERKLIAEAGAAPADDGDAKPMLCRKPLRLPDPLGRFDCARGEGHRHAGGNRGFLCHAGTIETGGRQVNAACALAFPPVLSKLAGSPIRAPVPEDFWRICTRGAE